MADVKSQLKHQCRQRTHFRSRHRDAIRIPTRTAPLKAPFWTIPKRAAAGKMPFSGQACRILCANDQNGTVELSVNQSFSKEEQINQQSEQLFAVSKTTFDSRRQTDVNCWREFLMLNKNCATSDQYQPDPEGMNWQSN